MQTWKAWLAALAVLLAVFFGALAVTYIGDFMKPEVVSPKWMAVYDDTNKADWCARGYINGERCDIVEGPSKDGHLYQIWYDNTVFWHYEEEYTLPHEALFTNGDWSFMVESYDFKGGYR